MPKLTCHDERQAFPAGLASELKSALTFLIEGHLGGHINFQMKAIQETGSKSHVEAPSHRFHEIYLKRNYDGREVTARQNSGLAIRLSARTLQSLRSNDLFYGRTFPVSDRS